MESEFKKWKDFLNDKGYQKHTKRKSATFIIPTKVYAQLENIKRVLKEWKANTKNGVK